MIALYARVSTQEQATEGYSIGEQQERLRSFASSFGWSDVKMYTDPGFSGASLDRPGMQALIRDVEAGMVQKVVVYKLDRLSRSQKDTLSLIEDVFLPNGCEFISMSESFSTETPVGRATIGLLAVFAQLERDTIKERLMVGRTARAKAGFYHGGGEAPAGYDYVDGALVVNEAEAMQVREIFRLYASGLTLRQVRDHMNASGLLFRGSPWTRDHIKAVLKNSLYLGMVTFAGVEYPGAHDPLVDEEVFRRCSELLASRRTDFSQNHTSSYSGPRLLLGIAYCKKCGSRLTSSASVSKGRLYDYYACSAVRDRGAALARGVSCDAKPVRREKLEEAVLSQIMLLRTDPSFVPGGTKKKPDERPALLAQIEKLDAQISRLLDLYVSGSFSVELLEQKTQSLREARYACSERLQMLEAENSSGENKNAKKALQSFADAVEEGDPARLKMLIRALISRVEFYGDDLDIYWKFE